MGSNNQKKGMRGTTRRIRSRCDLNSVFILNKPIGGAALRLPSLCAGLNREMAREVRGV